MACLVYTTAEIVITVVPNVEFRRVLDPRKGHPELEVRGAHQGEVRIP